MFFRYDKYKEGFKSEECFGELLQKDILFLCLPTLYEDFLEEYDKSAITETCMRLNHNKYAGVVVLKSTVEPGTTQKLSDEYPNLTFVHNPEFLSARTCDQDFEQQSHIVLGRPKVCNEEK